MAKVTHVQSARPSKHERSCHKCSKPINVGDSYKWFATRIGRSSNRKDFCDACEIRPSDKTTSGPLQTLYLATEAAEDALTGLTEDYGLDDVAAILTEAAEGVREAAQMYEESAQNMEDGFGHATSLSDEIKDKAEELESFATELEDAASEIEDLEDPNEDEDAILADYDGDDAEDEDDEDDEDEDSEEDDEDEKELTDEQEEYITDIREQRREAAVEKANEALCNCPM